MAIVDDYKAIAAQLSEFDFSCRVCGVQCDSAPPLPARAVCPAHCEDHDYVYERGMGGKYCRHCNAPPPYDYYDDVG